MNNFSMEIRGDVGILNINILRVTVNGVSEFKEYLNEFKKDNLFKVVINLSSVVFIDSAMIGALVAANQELKKIKGALHLVLSPNNMNELLHPGILKTIFEIYDSVDEAIISFKAE